MSFVQLCISLSISPCRFSHSRQQSSIVSNTTRRRTREILAKHGLRTGALHAARAARLTSVSNADDDAGAPRTQSAGSGTQGSPRPCLSPRGTAGLQQPARPPTRRSSGTVEAAGSQGQEQYSSLRHSPPFQAPTRRRIRGSAVQDPVLGARSARGSRREPLTSSLPATRDQRLRPVSMLPDLTSAP